ncbi:MAG: SCO family protein [Planctomycetota bacterium]|nr:SCO family protein [Planctomycetota bacterium]MDA0935339.1 SCO family protein [Planctomycetota bacterium]
MRLATLALACAAAMIGADGQLTAQTKSHAGSRWGADYFPNVELTNQFGEPRRFFDDLLEDKVVLINFMYTSCPDACPLETARLKEVYEILDGRVGDDVFFYSISIDPAIDTPEVMAEYAARFGTGAGWEFLTGDAEDIRSIRKKLGMIQPDEERLEEHTLSIMIGNQATGQWTRRSPMENPYMLANYVGGWLHNWKGPATPRMRMDEAPERLRNISRGEDLFRTRCSACHAVGTEGAGAARPGPDLFGVTERRDDAWLRRWIAEPDKVLAEGDPLAHELLAQWGRVPMPNLRLDAEDVDEIVRYLADETERQASEAAAAPAAEKASCCEKDDLLVLERDLAADGEDAPAPKRSPLLASMAGAALLLALAGVLRARAA